MQNFLILQAKTLESQIEIPTERRQKYPHKRRQKIPAIVNNEHSNFFRAESILKGLPFTSKAATVYFGQIVWYWIKGNIPRFEKKIRPDTN